jgi:hypothetical protein
MYSSCWLVLGHRSWVFSGAGALVNVEESVDGTHFYQQNGDLFSSFDLVVICFSDGDARWRRVVECVMMV